MCVYSLCVCTHSPQVPARCWRFYRSTVQYVYSMCVLCVLCVYSFCVYIYSTNYRSLNTAGNFTGELYSVCLYNVSVQYRWMWVQSNSMCVYTLTTGPCTLLEILQVYCTVCLYILCVYCVYNVHLYRICMCTCIHLPRSLYTAGDFTGVQTFFVRKHCGGVVAGRTEALGEDTLRVVEARPVYHNLHTEKKVDTNQIQCNWIKF